MRRKISPVLAAGLLIFLIYSVMDRFIVRIPDVAAIPVLLLAIALIIAGGLKKPDRDGSDR